MTTAEDCVLPHFMDKKLVGGKASALFRVDLRTVLNWTLFLSLDFFTRFEARKTHDMVTG